MTIKIMVLAISIFAILVTLSCQADDVSPLTPDELEQIHSNDIISGYYGARKIIIGPATASLGDIAKLYIPKDYIYVESEKTYGKPLNNLLNTTCSSYISLRYKNKRRLCFKISNLGYLRLSEDLSSLKERANELQQAILKSHFKNVPEPVDFKWLQLPKYNRQDHTLSWAYHHIITKQNEYNGHKKTVEDKEINIIRFGKQHIIWLTNNDNYTAGEYLPQLADWGKRIVFNEGYQYQENQAPTCYGLAPGDSALEGNAYDYSADPERCFPYPIESLITGLSTRTYGNENIFQFISLIRIYRRLEKIQ
ncbi:DUF2167 domain-containing protein [Klebsiella variicola]|uniref:DUF2167 domain-containing protein n=1 Tax=Klebsiella variicola TaxID=244366 RepID=UPI00109BDC57|nr:DUF2167 domain-containing protein [Klebsiella variicola]VGP88135.1 hypothetical protein SB5387_02590 [Klebsiella variicola]